MANMHPNMENLIDLRDRPLEERRRISRMGAEKRKKNREEREQKMILQRCMKKILALEVNKESQKNILLKFGLEESELNNKALLMVALFQKALTGDVSAIKEIVEMVDKLDMYEESGKLQSGNVTINLLPVGETQQQTETQDEQELWDENISDWMETDTDDEWGMDIYNG